MRNSKDIQNKIMQQVILSPNHFHSPKIFNCYLQIFLRSIKNQVTSWYTYLYWPRYVIGSNKFIYNVKGKREKGITYPELL